ncbi:MAG: hypothetical protein NTW87_18595 [Planctomycetota bacterium]|nr:hypothetical protein [Planctomycetota bacterium]
MSLVSSGIAVAGEPAPKKQPAPKDQPAPKTQPPPKTANPPSGDDIAAKTPVKTLEEGGILISPAIAKSLRAALQRAPKGADPHEVLFVGPGMASGEKDKLIPKAAEGWMNKAGPASVTSGDLSGLDMMQKLPDVLAKSRPGVVVVIGSLSRDKGGPTETQDWRDVCMQCLRYGAIPAIGVPDAKDENAPARTLFKSAAGAAAVPAYDLLGGASAGAERAGILLKMLGEFVLSKGKDAAPPADE